MNIIVSNTGPILHLYEADLIDLLQKAGIVYVPSKVNLELTYLITNWGKDRKDWIEVISLTSEEKIQANFFIADGLIDEGEAEAIVLSIRIKPKWFLTDDSKARKIAETFNLAVHGSMGVVIWSAQAGYLNRYEAENAISRLHESTLWISKKVMNETLYQLHQIFE